MGEDLRDSISKILSRSEKTAEILRYNIEIAEEGQSRAIVVFTLVTIVFLPLSFVSSFFGMNTVDVRDTTATQGLFWATALPVTVLICAVSVLVAYRGEVIWSTLR